MGGVVSHGRRGQKGQNRSDPGGDSLRPVADPLGTLLID